MPSAGPAANARRVGALWRARGQAVLEDTERRIARVRKAVVTICQVGPHPPIRAISWCVG
jgi:hypothetical protein